VDDDGRKQERKIPAKGSAEFQKVNNPPGTVAVKIIANGCDTVT
jgi:uncharacterized protein (UPF0218 family)